ncbi:MAG: HMA2 domain-containing protein [Desulfovibrionaceae bacterium]
MTVKHHIPGRIRLKFNPAVTKHPEVKKLMNGNHELPAGVESYRINPMALSLIIEYDAERIDPDLLEELAATRNDERASAIVEELYQTLMHPTQ